MRSDAGCLAETPHRSWSMPLDPNLAQLRCQGADPAAETSDQNKILPAIRVVSAK
jgi:hypothetical protein